MADQTPTPEQMIALAAQLRVKPADLQQAYMKSWFTQQAPTMNGQVIPDLMRKPNG